MIWALSVLSIIFIILILNHKPAISKSYSEKIGQYDIFPMCGTNEDLDNHLNNIKHEVKVRAYIKEKQNELLNNNEDIGVEVRVYNPDEPAIYEKILYSTTQRFWRKISYVLMIFYALIIFQIISVPIDEIVAESVIDLIKGWMYILVKISLIPVLVWLFKRSYGDGRTEGFLNGYLQAYQDILVYKIEKDMKIELNKEASNSYYDKQQPYSHGIRLWE